MDIAQGTVFFIQHRELTSPKPHYLVVLNYDPNSAQYIVFGVITSGIELARRRIARNSQPEETLVIITPDDYGELEHDSVIDCNTPVKLSNWEFDKSFAQISACRKSDMPKRVCDAVIAGVMASSMVAPNIKKLLKRL